MSGPRPNPGPGGVLRGAAGQPRALAWAPGGGGSGALAVGDDSGALGVWDARLQRLLLAPRTVHEGHAGVAGLEWVDGTVFTQGGDGVVKAWPWRPEGPALGEEPAFSVACGTYNYCRMSVLGPAGLLACTTADATVVGLWDLRADPARECVALKDRDQQLGMCMALKLVEGAAAGGAPHLCCGHENGAVALWDCRRLDAPLASRKFFREPAMCLDLCPEKLKGVLGSAEKELALFRFKAGECKSIGRLETKARGAGHLALRADKKIFAAACWDNKVRVYDFKQGKPLAVLSHHSAAVSCVRFSADSARLASAGDTSVALWDIYAPKEDAGGAGGG